MRKDIDCDDISSAAFEMHSGTNRPIQLFVLLILSQSPRRLGASKQISD